MRRAEYRPVDADTCKRAERNRVTRQGILFPKDNKTLLSRNILKPVFSYPWTTVNKCENFKQWIKKYLRKRFPTNHFEI